MSRIPLLRKNLLTSVKRWRVNKLLLSVCHYMCVVECILFKYLLLSSHPNLYVTCLHSFSQTGISRQLLMV
jgi:hypothetical protein